MDVNVWVAWLQLYRNFIRIVEHCQCYFVWPYHSDHMNCNRGMMIGAPTLPSFDRAVPRSFVKNLANSGLVETATKPGKAQNTRGWLGTRKLSEQALRISFQWARARVTVCPTKLLNPAFGDQVLASYLSSICALIRLPVVQLFATEKPFALVTSIVTFPSKTQNGCNLSLSPEGQAMTQDPRLG